jgi:membrane protein
MPNLNRFIQTLDNFQRRHFIPSFLYGVIKKYGQDNAGYQAAIVTYYGLLSLFPLIFVLTSLSQLLLKSHAVLKAKIAASVTHYFPLIGNQLEKSIHSPKRIGLELIVSLAITFYGARGVASAIQYAFNTLWGIPRFKQPSFLKSTLRSLAILGSGGLGLITAGILSGYAASTGHAMILKVLSTVLSILVLGLSMILVFKLSVAGHRTIRQVFLGAAIATIGIQILQSVGTAILDHELKQLNQYGIFALFIGLSFWVYLQIEVILYALEVNVVKLHHLYPRSLTGPLSEEDKTAITKITKATKLHQTENVEVDFNNHDK